MKLSIARLDSPIGPLQLVASGRGLCALAFEDRWDAERRTLARRFAGEVLEPGPVAAATALAAYFAGDLRALDAIEVDLGGTEFQRLVWAELRRIPVGETTSYGALARAIGQPSATRAVGAANGSNPIAIVIPCHRVIGAGGKLTGYGGGLERKRWLLEHERALSPLWASLDQR